MRVRIDEKKCIGCGLCAELCPSHFSMGDYVAKVVVDEVSPQTEEDLRAASEDCPVTAISFEEAPGESRGKA